MKKFIALVAAMMMMFMMAGCDIPNYDWGDGDGDNEICVIYNNDGQCMAYTTVEETTPAENGLSAYDLALENGFEGTLDEWLTSLVGEAGEDGICPVCDTPVEDPVEPTADVFFLSFLYSIEGISNVEVGHLLDGALVSIEDANITDDNGTYSLDADVEVLEPGTHSIGITFDKE